MEQSLHTVLGATGATGHAVITELLRRSLPVRAVERRKDVEGIPTVKADLLDPAQALRAIEGSSHVYLCVGLPYNAETWQREWPPVMTNVIEACAATGARLIFFDNMYMYGPPPLSMPFDENEPQSPTTRKGKTRKAIADQLMEAFRSGRVKGLIGRAADFYGPRANNSPLYISILERMLQGKAPQSVAAPGVVHTYACSMDNGRALVALALDESTYGQVWHLPVGPPATVDELIAIMNKLLGTSLKPQYLPGFMLMILSWFVPPLKEVREMLYQFNQPYVMSYEKFRNKFPDFEVTDYETGFRDMIESARRGEIGKSNA